MGPARVRVFSSMLFFCAVLLWSGEGWRPYSGVEIDPGGRASTLVQLDPSRWVLVTDGNVYSTDRTIRRLQQRGINRLHALVVSHSRADVGSVERITKLFSPSEIWMAPDLREEVVAKGLLERGVPLRFSFVPIWTVGDGQFGVRLGRKDY